MAETCPLCRQRKGKRACPAKSAAICSHCCGTKRRVEIACPEDCVYLGGSHSEGWEGRETERRRDLLRIAPFIRSLSDDQSRLFFLALVGIHGIRAGRRELDDPLLAQAVAAFRKTLETRSHGLLYDHTPEDARAVGLLADLKGLFEAKDEEGRPTTPDEKDLAAVVGALDDAVSHAVRESPGGTAFLDTIARLAAQMGAPQRASRPLIVAP